MIRFLLFAPDEKLEAVKAILRDKYTNIRFREHVRGEPRKWRWAQQVYLTRHWWRSIATYKDYSNSPVETVVQALDSANGQVHLQYLLVPTISARMQRALKKRVASLEYQAGKMASADPANPGVGYTVSQEVKDALQAANSLWFRTEIRLAADDWNDAQRVYGAIAEASGENRFDAGTVVLFKKWWLRWFHLRLPSILLFRSRPMSSFSLATLIHLPSIRLRVTRLERILVRRAPAPLTACRDPGQGLVAEEVEGQPGEPVGILAGDQHSNLLILGSQGSGKSTDELAKIRADAAWKDERGRCKAMVVMDIGKDTARRALGVIPPEREVVWLDAADPACPWSINPMLIDAADTVVVDSILYAMIAVFGEDAIQSNSKMFLRSAIHAVREVEGLRGDFFKVYGMLVNQEYRDRIRSQVRDSFQREYWQVEFENFVRNDPRYLTQLMAPPKNKLHGIMSNHFVRAALAQNIGRVMLNMDDIVRGRKILVCNLDKSKLGVEGARLLGVFVLVLLWYALMRQVDTEESERVPVSIVIDEAQNFLTDAFMDILAEGRAFGAQTTVALRFLGELPTEKVQDGLKALAENVIVHRFALVKEAEERMRQVMRVFANMVQVTAESQDKINLGADDFMRLPRFWSVCRFLVNGTPAPAFVGMSMPWERFYHQEWADHHRRVNGLRELPAATQTRSDQGGADAEDAHGGDNLPVPVGIGWERDGTGGAPEEDAVVLEEAVGPDGRPVFVALGELANQEHPETGASGRVEGDMAAAMERALKLLKECYGANEGVLRDLATRLGATQVEATNVALWIVNKGIQPKGTIYSLYRAVLKKAVDRRGGGKKLALADLERALQEVAARFSASRLSLETLYQKSGVPLEDAVGLARWMVEPERDIPAQKVYYVWEHALKNAANAAKAKEILEPVAGRLGVSLDQLVKVAKSMRADPARVSRAAEELVKAAEAGELQNPVAYFRKLLRDGPPGGTSRRAAGD